MSLYLSKGIKKTGVRPGTKIQQPTFAIWTPYGYRKILKFGMI